MFAFPLFQLNNEFQLILRKDRKYDTIKLSSEFRNDILTSLFKYHKEFAEKIKTEVSCSLFVNRSMEKNFYFHSS